MRAQLLSILLLGTLVACGSSDPAIGSNRDEARPEIPKVPPPVIHAPPDPLAIERYGAPLDAPPDATDVSVDPGGGVWAASSRGLFLRPAGSRFFVSAGALPSAVAIGGLGPNLAAATWTRGAATLVREGRDETLRFSELPAIDPASRRIRPVDLAGSPATLVASGPRLVVLDPGGGLVATRALPVPVEASDVALSPKGAIWMASRVGLFRLGMGPTGALASSFSAVDLLAGKDDDVVALDGCPDGTVWASSLGHGVYRVGDDGTVLEHLTSDTVLPQDHVLSIVCDLDGSVWFGTSWGGLARRMKDGSMRYHTQSAGLPGDSVRRLFLSVDHAGNRTIWMATEGGLASYDGP